MNFFRALSQSPEEGRERLSGPAAEAAQDAAQKADRRTGKSHQAPGRRQACRQEPHSLPQQDEKANAALAPHQQEEVGDYRRDRPPSDILEKSAHRRGRAAEPPHAQQVVAQAQRPSHRRGQPKRQHLGGSVDLDLAHLIRRLKTPPLGRSSV